MAFLHLRLQCKVCSFASEAQFRPGLSVLQGHMLNRLHHKSLVSFFVVFNALLMKRKVTFLWPFQVILIEDFVQYLLGCLKRWDGRSIISQLIVLMPLPSLWSSGEVVGCGKSCLLQQTLEEKGFFDVRPHFCHLQSTTQLPAEKKTDWELQGTQRNIREKLLSEWSPSEMYKRRQNWQLFFPRNVPFCHRF